LVAFIGFLPIIGTFRPMSLFSTNIDDAVKGGPSGQDPIEELYAKLMVAAAVFFVVFEVMYFVVGGLPSLTKLTPDGTKFLIGRDFFNTWMGGRSMFFGGPAAWFDLRTYNAVLERMLGPDYPEVYWSYPPHVVLFVWPFGLLPYFAAYIAWSIVGLAVYLLVCSTAIPRKRMLFVAVAPCVIVCIFFGQNGFFTAALLIGGLLNLDRRPILAGVLFGILTVKPQLGLLLPMVLLLERRWLTIASAVVTTGILVALTSMLFGWHIWIEFWQKVVPQQVWLTETGEGLLLSLVASPFYAVRMFNLPLNIAWDFQYIVSTCAFAAVAWTFWKRRDQQLSLALLVTSIFLVTPYILNYDMVVLGFVVALLRDRPDNTVRDHHLLIAVWTLPVMMMLARLVFIPLAPIVLIAFACRLLWRLAHSSAREVKALPGDLSPASA
jgi:alpha-1,2-mannosyltransferase